VIAARFICATQRNGAVQTIKFQIFGRTAVRPYKSSQTPKHLPTTPTKQKIQKKFGTFPPDQSKNPVPKSGNPSKNLEHRQ